MARSNIIKEFVSSDISLGTIFKKLIVLFNDIGDIDLNLWAHQELCGYESENIDNRPEYRELHGRLKGTFVIGNIQYKDTFIPTNNVDKGLLHTCTKVYVQQSVLSLECMASQKKETMKPMDQSMCEDLSRIFGCDLQTIYVVYDYTMIIDLIEKLKSKVIDILLKLEREFENLDDLYIDFSKKDIAEQKKIVQDINYIIFNNYNDNRINIGNNNNLKKSSVISNLNTI